MNNIGDIPAGILEFIETAVQIAVEQALSAGRQQAQETTRNAYKDTEKRLHAYSVLLDKVEDSKERLQDMINNGLSPQSRSLVRFSRSGSRLQPEEILDALITDMQAKIAADEYEIQEMERALKTIEGDPYYSVVYGKFIEHKTDEGLAEELFCDPSTVRRNRGRLVRRLAVWFYGSDAL